MLTSPVGASPPVVMDAAFAALKKEVKGVAQIHGVGPVVGRAEIDAERKVFFYGRNARLCSGRVEVLRTDVSVEFTHLQVSRGFVYSDVCVIRQEKGKPMTNGDSGSPAFYRSDNGGVLLAGMMVAGSPDDHLYAVVPLASMESQLRVRPVLVN
jgi:hypothetical protein